MTSKQRRPIGHHDTSPNIRGIVQLHHAPDRRVGGHGIRECLG
jgi:hypothetical protein